MTYTVGPDSSTRPRTGKITIYGWGSRVMQRLAAMADGLCASPAALRVFRMLGKTVVEGSLLDHPDGSLLDQVVLRGQSNG
jgi:hypothetical protein